MRCQSFAAVLCFVSLVAGLPTGNLSAGAAEPGSVKGRFVYEGKDEGGKVKITKDEAFCNPHAPNDESIELGENGGLLNVFVYLVVKRGETIEITPAYADAPGSVTLDNSGCRFEPHALTIWTKQKLEIKNSDTIGHNTNATLVANPSFNQLISKDQPFVVDFKKEERLPSTVQCNIHPWMSAYVLIRDNPYMTVSGKDGSFEIKVVPAGKHDFAFWHEAGGYVRDLKVGKGKTDRKGIVSLEIAAGKELDLGDLQVAPKQVGK